MISELTAASNGCNSARAQLTRDRCNSTDRGFLKTTSYERTNERTNEQTFLLLALFCLKVGSHSTTQGSLNLAATFLSHSSVLGLRSVSNYAQLLVLEENHSSHDNGNNTSSSPTGKNWKEKLSWLDWFLST